MWANKRKVFIFFFAYHHFFIAFFFSFLLWFSAWFVFYSIEQDHMSTLMRLSAETRTFEKEPFTAPFYTEFTKQPSLDIKTYNDLFGHIDIYKAQGKAKLERAFFYLKLDYAVVYVATNYVVDRGAVLPKEEHCILIFRTLIDYRDLWWQSYEVRAIHEALASLNEELIKLLVQYYVLDKFYEQSLTFKDFNLVTLKHSAIAQTLDFTPADLAWGRFSREGLAEYQSIYTWDWFRKPKIRDEILQEYIFIDLDYARHFLEVKIQENVALYNQFMGQKLRLEAIDLERAGKKSLTYEDRVHYRTYADEDFIFRYKKARAWVNTQLLYSFNVATARDLEHYNWTFDPELGKSFYAELYDKVETDLAKRQAENRARFYMKK